MKINAFTLAVITIATAQFAHSASLFADEVQSVRSVLRSMNFDERQISDNQIENLRKRGTQLRHFENLKRERSESIDNGEVSLTCGAGSHGGSGDPVGR